MRKSWRVFHDRSLIGRCFRGFVLPVLEYCSAVWCSAADTHLKLLVRAVSGAGFYLEVCLSETLLIVDLWQSCACFIRSGVTRCTLLMVLYLDRFTSAGFTPCSGRTPVYLCTASPQNLAVQQDFHSTFSVPLERSC